MKTPLLPGLALALASVQVAPAAPSIEMPREWVVPLETGQGYALVDKSTGQIRFHTFNLANVLSEVGPLESALPTVTGVASGYTVGGVEHVLISSVTSNRIIFAPRNGGTPVSMQQQVPGPENSIPFIEPGKPTAVLVHSLYGTNGHAVEMTEAPTTSPLVIDLIESGLPPLHALQPFRNPDLAGARWGVALYDFTSPPRLLEIYRDATDIEANSLVQMDAGSRLTTEVIGDDGRFCTIGWRPGQTTSQIVTHGFLGFAVNLSPPTPDPGFAPGFRIGTIAPVTTGIPGAPNRGVLITALDGSVAYYATVVSGVKYAIQATFQPSPGSAINGLVPVPGVGFLTLEGDPASRVSKGWRLFRESAGNWNEVRTGALSSWLPPTTDFATLFWFQGTPLVEPFAKLLKFETVPDWTNGGGALPAGLTSETFVSTAAGLDNPIGIAPSAPAGATYVMANQYQGNASVSALADTLTLSTPSVSVTPPSGTYAEAVTVNALFDDTTLELFYREDRPATSWRAFTNIPLTVGYPSTWLFYAREIATGASGPIITRSYQFSVDLNSIDTDGDSVPDYVEREHGLDPAAGGDSDGDFQSDLEELLAGTDPADHTSNTPQALRNPPYLGEGFYVYAQAYNPTTGFAAPYNDGGTPTTIPIVDESVAATQRADDTPGTKLNAADMRATALGTGQVARIASGPLTGQYAARIDVSNQLAEREWLILSSPTYFNLGTSIPAPRTGRETFRVMKRPTFTLPVVAFAPSGTDPAADAAGWLAGATAAYAAFQSVTALTRLDPEDNAIAALAEQALYSSLRTLDPGEQAALGVPASVANFTLFGLRNGEAGKTQCTQEMLDALLAAGCDFTAIINLLDGGARASVPILSLADAIYARHVAISDATPNMALPLDAFRSLIRTGTIVDPGETVATSYNPDGSVAATTTRTNPYATISAALRNAAKAEMDALLAGIAATKRPTEVWTLVIEAPTTLGHRYDYRRQTPPNNLAWLVDSFGDRFILEQGLGLNLGTVFTVTGYTDVSPVAGFDTMEIIAINSVVTPIASDSDSNGNLLDDEWELFFFGALGLVGPFDLHPISGHTYLQYHLAGADPRAGDLTDPVLTVLPTAIDFVRDAGLGAYNMEFTFPDAYISNFTFSLNASTTLQGFTGPAHVGSVTNIGPNRYALRVSPAAAALNSNYFQIEMALAAP